MPQGLHRWAAVRPCTLQGKATPASCTPSFIYPLNLSPKVFAIARSLCRTPRLTGWLAAADTELAAGRLPFLLEADRRSGAAGVPEPPPTSTQSLFLSISATLTSAAYSFSEMLPMRLNCNYMCIPSKLEVPTRWPLMTCSLSCKNCRSRIPPSDFKSVRAVRSRKASWDRFFAADPHHRESKLRCSGGQGTYILCSKVCRHSTLAASSAPPTTALLLSAAPIPYLGMFF